MPARGALQMGHVLRAGGGMQAGECFMSNILQALTPVPPKFSVCIPTFNDVQAFTRCLDSVLKQREISLECIVSDDSTSNDIACCAVRSSDRRVIYHHNEVRTTPTANWNRAVRFARGTFITLLHQDDWYRSEYTLYKILTVFENENADVLFCGRALFHDDRCLGEYLATQKKISDLYKGFPSKTLVVNKSGSPSVVFFHRKHNNILYDTALVYFADTEYFFRLIAASDKYTICSKPYIGINRSTTQLSTVCLSKIDTIIPELAYCLHKHNAALYESGMALARFFAANLRHWRINSLIAAMENVKKNFSLATIGIFTLSFPIFFIHMLYRAAYRQTTGRVWG
jgi:glycosyltransferase involved in cell wall biosynthesis